MLARRIVTIVPIGSTSPERTPLIKALILDSPLLLRGIDIIAPSGKFCIAIPSARARAPAEVMPLVPVIHPAYTTPTAIPSGIL